MSLKPDEIRAMKPEERLKKLQELKLELMRLRTQAAMGTLDNPGKIRAIRKTIARILTIQREEELKKLREGGKKRRK
ncbi:MAG TPA: 50S ribosomal protein L29 [Desulfurococcales archaeon]|nr:50S ribosomal protein L29 [Desulfurococcales archaeon]